jgi:hypothetical protein
MRYLLQQQEESVLAGVDFTLSLRQEDVSCATVLSGFGRTVLVLMVCAPSFDQLTLPRLQQTLGHRSPRRSGTTTENDFIKTSIAGTEQPVDRFVRAASPKHRVATLIWRNEPAASKTGSIFYAVHQHLFRPARRRLIRISIPKRDADRRSDLSL